MLLLSGAFYLLLPLLSFYTTASSLLLQHWIICTLFFSALPGIQVISAPHQQGQARQTAVLWVGFRKSEHKAQVPLLFLSIEGEASSCSSFPNCAEPSWPQKAIPLFLFILSSSINPNYVSSARALIDTKQKPILQEALWKARMLMHAPHFSFPWRKNSEDRVFSLSIQLCQLGVGLVWAKWNCSSYPFQWSCSCLCAALGYCNFLIGFWNSHKSILVHILLSNCLVFLWGNKGWGFLFHHLVDITSESALLK